MDPPPKDLAMGHNEVLSLTTGDGSMNDINTLGIDLAKNDFQLNGVDRLGHCVLK